MELYLDVTLPTGAKASPFSLKLEDHHLIGQSPSAPELKLGNKGCREVEVIVLRAEGVSARVIRVGSYGDVKVGGETLATGASRAFHPGDTLLIDGLTVQLRSKRPSRALASFRMRCDNCGTERGNDEPLFIDAAWLCDECVPELGSEAFHIGSFDVVKEIGRGGQAKVFEAIQRRTHFRAALKTPLPGKGAQVMERFAQRELRIAQAVRHPRIVSLYECGLYEGFHYAAFEYMSDGSAAQAPRLGLTLVDVLTVARDAFEGLHYLHELGIVHRDLSPGNILLRKRGGRMRAKISDLGYAKSLDDFARTTHTGGGGPVIFGTPGFVSPSRLSGEEATPADDVYGAAVVVYWLLANQTPHGFRGGGKFLPEHMPVSQTHVSIQHAVRERFGKLPQGLVQLLDALTHPYDGARTQEGAARRVLGRLEELLAPV